MRVSLPAVVRLARMATLSATTVVGSPSSEALQSSAIQARTAPQTASGRTLLPATFSPARWLDVLVSPRILSLASLASTRTGSALWSLRADWVLGDLQVAAESPAQEQTAYARQTDQAGHLVAQPYSPRAPWDECRRRSGRCTLFALRVRA